jgi:hypothetical protein
MLAFVMRGPKPSPIILTPTQRDTLKRLKRRQKSPQRLVCRVQIILEAASGANNAQIARLLGIDRGQVRTPGASDGLRTHQL